MVIRGSGKNFRTQVSKAGRKCSSYCYKKNKMREWKAIFILQKIYQHWTVVVAARVLVRFQIFGFLMLPSNMWNVVVEGIIEKINCFWYGSKMPREIRIACVDVSSVKKKIGYNSGKALRIKKMFAEYLGTTSLQVQ